MTGALVGLGLPEHEAKFYNEEIERCGILVGVYSHSDRSDQAKKILEAAGAEGAGAVVWAEAAVSTPMINNAATAPVPIRNIEKIPCSIC